MLPRPRLVLRSAPSPAMARPGAPRLTSPRSVIFRPATSRLGHRTISAAILTSSWRPPSRLTAPMLPAEFDRHMRGTESPGLVHLSCTALGLPLPVTPRPRCSLRRHRLHPSLMTIAGNGDVPHPCPPAVSITNEDLPSPVFHLPLDLSFHNKQVSRDTKNNRMTLPTLSHSWQLSPPCPD